MPKAMRELSREEIKALRHMPMDAIITVRALGKVVTGKVEMPGENSNYGTPDDPDWYLMLRDQDTRKAVYFRQRGDRGEIVRVFVPNEEGPQ